MWRTSLENYYVAKSSFRNMQISTRIERQVDLIAAVLAIQTALKLIHGKTRNSCLRHSSTGAHVDISWCHYRCAWRDSNDVIFLPYSADRERHLILWQAKRYSGNLTETLHIHYLIEQYLKHEKIWLKNVLLKQKEMLFYARLSSSETR